MGSTTTIKEELKWYQRFFYPETGFVVSHSELFSDDTFAEAFVDWVNSTFSPWEILTENYSMWDIQHDYIDEKVRNGELVEVQLSNGVISECKYG